ncbi:DUF7033 domain-containing protein [Flavilitoribacter nigricans]|uniref:DUF7033 domain-containing protein n=1 Tax=Flavilitoribacter nigricans (strain ATCC 23147 / DSM 23189 / NBRC 102662 / NCIMB 1420 / SS-2) TaxID=1122177 RepID=A0A2D0N168_FLAN2|nr:hypothetical protein [Flavilitoribacter nigricans]PHN01463.1 hypothetical protein CRP01_36795 [Flavilitoribacter nigricans DSM 23189 = NBRC 102662]
MRTLVIHTGSEHPALQYTLDFIRQHPLTREAGWLVAREPGTDASEIQLFYGAPLPENDDHFFIPAQGLCFGEPSVTRPLFANPYSFQDISVFSVEDYRQDNSRPLLQGNHFQFDLLEMIFFHISRYEEVFATAGQLNSSGWLAEEQHFLIRHQLQRQPVVDCLLACFWSAIQGQPVHLPTTYSLSHDIDFLYRYPTTVKLLRALAGAFVRGEGVSGLRYHWQRYRAIRRNQQPDPYDCFDWLLAPGTGWDKKTLYLMAGGETPYDNHYRIDDPRIRSLIGLARNRDYQLGLHPSYNAAFKPALFREEQAKLEQVYGKSVHNNRQHWLRWDWPTTPYIYGLQHIREDASMGYRHHLGFRAGTGFPYRLYDYQSQKAFDWRERPLALMDSAALHEADHTGIDPVALLNDFLQQNTGNSHISINFHNSNFDPALPHGQALADFYRRTILHLAG